MLYRSMNACTSFVDLPDRELLIQVRRLAQVERDYIVATLHSTNGVLGGWDGAAARLGLSRTTLISRMQRLGITAGSGLTQSRLPHGISRSQVTYEKNHLTAVNA